jgi:hypothetical protein
MAVQPRFGQSRSKKIPPLYSCYRCSRHHGFRSFLVFRHDLKQVYDVRVDRVERVQMRFIGYALHGLGWTDMHDLPPYENRCALLHLDTLAKRRSVACVMFIFDVLRGRVNSPGLLSVLHLIAPRYLTRGTEFLRIDFQRTNY